MKHLKAVLFVACYLALVVGGCVVNKNESAGTGNEQAPGVLRTIAETALSWKGVAATAAGGLLATGAVAKRGRRWKRAYHVTADEIEKHDDKALKQKLAKAHGKAGVADLASAQVKKYRRPW